MHLFCNEYSYPHPQKTTREVNFWKVLASISILFHFWGSLFSIIKTCCLLVVFCLVTHFMSESTWFQHFIFSLKHTSYHVFHTYSLHCSLTHSRQFFSLNLCKQVQRTASTRSVQFHYYFHDWMMMKNKKKCNSTIFYSVLSKTEYIAENFFRMKTSLNKCYMRSLFVCTLMFLCMHLIKFEQSNNLFESMQLI